MKPYPEYKIVSTLFFGGLLMLLVYIFFGLWKWGVISFMLVLLSLPFGLLFSSIMALYERFRQQRSVPNHIYFSPLHQWVLYGYVATFIILEIILPEESIWPYTVAYAIPIHLLTAAFFVKRYEQKNNAKGLRWKDIFPYKG